MIVIMCQDALPVSQVCREELLCWWTILLGSDPDSTITTINFTNNVAVAARLWEEVEGK